MTLEGGHWPYFDLHHFETLFDGPPKGMMGNLLVSLLIFLSKHMI